MTFSVKPRLLTIDEYHKMAEAGILTQEDRVELIEGKILEMSAIGSLHAAYVNKITALLIRLLPEAYIVNIQNPIIVGPQSEPEPDIAVLQPSPDSYAHQLPTAADVLLVIEVADSSLAYDREIKQAIYAKAGIAEYWLINLMDEQIEVYHDPSEEQYRHRELVGRSGRLRFRALEMEIEAQRVLM